MKKIEAIIRPEKLEDIKDALSKLNINGLTISQVMGCGKQKGWKEFFRGQEVVLNVLPKIKLEFIVADAQLEAIIEAITKTAHTGEVGDGKIFVYDVGDAIRIRTGERGLGAI